MMRGASGWREVSWDEALDVIAEKMKTIRDEDGPEAILYYQGYGERTALKLLNKYFFTCSEVSPPCTGHCAAAPARHPKTWIWKPYLP